MEVFTCADAALSSSDGDVSVDKRKDLSSFDDGRHSQRITETGTNNTKRVMQSAFYSASTLSACAGSPSRQALDAISSIDFSPNSSVFATGGIAKKIRIYRLAEDEFEEPELVDVKKRKRHVGSHLRKVEELYVPAKLSSVAWHPFNSTIICSGDYDGVVTEWDVQHGVAISERYGHGGQRVWSVDYSRSAGGGHHCASASSDGTVRLWSPESEESEVVLRPYATVGASMCCAKFSPFAPNLLAAASADGRFYLFDIRKPDDCVWSARGHARAISYVRFLDSGRLVSASIDNSLKLWDMSVNEPELLRTWEGEHVNVKNFVGLSALDKCGGLIACGSESNELFVYHSKHDRSLWRTKFPCVYESGRAFVGAVCWAPTEDCHDLVSVVAANSEGSLQLIQGSLVSSCQE